ncbi:MAG: YkgJ family cysteine cluster protein [Chlamydiae bacterium]|nr:YkgJ family cysteine cluster protein [Chlamydiota bacterium]
MTWYEKGLNFRCTGCGQCCTGAPGFVWLTDKDIENLSLHLELPTKEFLKRYTRFVHGRYSLTEKKPQYDCVFLKDNKCSVYEARPVQCRKFPWWPQNLTSKRAWQEAAKHCEGIDADDSKLFTKEEIETALSN